MSNHLELLGEWVLDPSDKFSIQEYGQILLKFSDNGTLTYSILGDETNQIIILIYEVEDDKIVTYQPSINSEKEKTLFSIQNGKLKLEFNGRPSMYLKLSSQEL